MEQITRTPLSLYGLDGGRKYVTPSERHRFIASAREHQRAEVETLCLVLAHTGCRISEALELVSTRIERQEGFIVFRSLKKRGRTAFREVPLPNAVVDRIAAVHDLNEPRPLWPWCRQYAWELVSNVFAAAGIGPGVHATCKGLRHGFAIHALQSGVPINLVQRWLGHASLTTTAIYLDAIGDEERELASRMWTEHVTDPSHRATTRAL